MIACTRISNDCTIISETSTIWELEKGYNACVHLQVEKYEVEEGETYCFQAASDQPQRAF